MSEIAGYGRDRAAIYARTAPHYPDSSIRELIDAAGVNPHSAIAEIGAGAGHFTRELSVRGLSVLALEPDPSMRAAAPLIERARWLDGRFEHTGLESGSVDWVVAAQSFHWAEPGLALPELARILRTHGSVSLLWNVRDHATPLGRWTRERVQARLPGFDEGYRDRDWGAVLESTGHFEHVGRSERPHVVSFSPGSYVDMWRSHQRLALALGTELEALLSEIEDHVEHLDRVDVAYRCVAHRARPRARTW